MRQKAETLSQTSSLKAKAFYSNFHNEINRSIDLYFSCKVSVEISLTWCYINTFILHVWILSKMEDNMNLKMRHET